MNIVLQPEEESEEEVTPRPARARGRKKQQKPEVEAECTSPQFPVIAGRKGRGRGTKAASNLDTGKEDSEALAASSEADQPQTDIQKEGEMVTEPQQTDQTTRGRARSSKPAPTSSDGSTAASQPDRRRSGRARRPKKFADESDEERGAVGKTDTEAVDVSVALHKKRGAEGRGRRKVAGEDMEAESTEGNVGGVAESSVKQAGSAALKDESAAADAGQASCSSERKTAKMEQASESADRIAGDGTAEGGSAHRAAATHVRKGSEISQEQNEDVPMNEAEAEKVETEPADESKTEDEVSQKGNRRAARSSGRGRKRARDTTADETVEAKRTKQSSGATDDQPIEDQRGEGMKSEDGDTALEDAAGRQGQKDRRTSRKSGMQAAAVSDSDRETETDRGSRSSSRAGVKGSTQSGSRETPTPAVGRPTRGKGRRKTDDTSSDASKDSGSQGTVMLAETEKSDINPDGDTTECQDTPAAPPEDKGRKEEAEVMDTDDSQESPAVTQKEVRVSGRRGRGRAAAKTESERTASGVPEKGPVGGGQPQAQQPTPAADSEDQGSSEKVSQATSISSRKRGRTAHGKVEVEDEKLADQASSGQENKSEDLNSGQDTNTSVSSRRKATRQAGRAAEKLEDDLDSAVTKKGRPTRKALQHADEPVNQEPNEDSQTSARGRATRKSLQPHKDEPTHKEQDEDSQVSTGKRGQLPKKQQKVELEESAALEPISKPGKKGRKPQEWESSTAACKPQEEEEGDGDTCTTKAEEREDTKSERKPAAARRGRQGKGGIAERDAAVGDTSEDHSLPKRRGQQAKKTQEPTSEEPAAEADDNKQDPTPTRRGRQTRTVSSHKGSRPQQQQEESSQDPPVSRRGRKAKAADSREKKESPDSQSAASTLSHSEDSQPSAASRSGRKGRTAQNTAQQSVPEQSAKRDGGGTTGRRGAKRAAEAPPGDAAASGAGETGDGPTPQKRGRKGREADPETKVKCIHLLYL